MTDYYTDILSTHSNKCEKLIEEWFRTLNEKKKAINDSYTVKVYTINNKSYKNETLKELVLQELEIKNKKQLLQEDIIFRTKVDKLNKKHKKFTDFCNKRIEQVLKRQRRILGLE